MRSTTQVQRTQEIQTLITERLVLAEAGGWVELLDGMLEDAEKRAEIVRSGEMKIGSEQEEEKESREDEEIRRCELIMERIQGGCLKAARCIAMQDRPINA